MGGGGDRNGEGRVEGIEMGVGWGVFVQKGEEGGKFNNNNRRFNVGCGYTHTLTHIHLHLHTHIYTHFYTGDRMIRYFELMQLKFVFFRVLWFNPFYLFLFRFA